MNSIYFSNYEINLLLRLIIAHLLSDFLLQTDKMVQNKKWVSKEMFAHIGIVYLTTALFSFLWWQSILIAFIHYLIDGIKISLKKNTHFKTRNTQLFILDQLAHISTIVIVWIFIFKNYSAVFETINKELNQFNFTLTLMAYIFISQPLGFLIGLATSKISNSEDQPEKTDKNGFRIGIFERIIILTFVLLSQYEAIGFLITGKSLLRFGSKDENKKSEYVLLGTMMSYAITIVFGIVLKQFLNE